LQQDSSLHQLEAQAVQAFTDLSIEGNTEAIRLIIRIAALKRLQVLTECASVGVAEMPLWGNKNLHAHVMSLDAPTGNIDSESLSDIQAVAEVLSELLSDADIPLSAEDVNHLLLAIQSNAHRVVDSHKRCVGLGMFPLTSMLNHSCNPNCSHHFKLKKGEPPLLVMQAIADIAEGEELCYNYIPLYQSTERRRLQLSSAYSFTCDCQRCTDATEPVEIVSPSTVFSFPTSKFPRDHILSDVNIASDTDSSTHVDVALDFETVVPCDGKVLNTISSEIAMCNNLLASAASNPKACKSVCKKLINFLSDKNKAGVLHPCHELVLNSYVTCAKVSESLLVPASDSVGLTPEETLQFARVSVGLGALALGCIIKFTHVRNDDVAELEAIIATGLQKLLVDGDSVASEEECREAFVRCALASLTSLQYVWASDSIVSELLAVACVYAAAGVGSNPSEALKLSQIFLTSSAISKTTV
jgi:hypothetical protein